MDKRIIVSVTSYSKRVGIVHKMIQSLYQQTIKPNKIILWLSLEEFPRKEKDIPKELIKLVGINGFEICWVTDNLKSHKKYYYVLQRYKKDIVIIVDDDIYYSSTMIEELMNSYYKFPKAISARNVHMILRLEREIADYKIWAQSYKSCKEVERKDFCAIGWGGILYPPYIASKRWFDVSAIKKYSQDQDDLWLKFNEILDGISVVYVEKKEEDIVIEGSQEFALATDNIFGNQNNRCLKNLLAWSNTQDYKIINQWIDSLQDCKEYYFQQREQLAIGLQNILEKNKNMKIYICGAGKFAQALIKLFIYCEAYKKIIGIVVSDVHKNPAIVAGIPVLGLTDIIFDNNNLIICGVSKKNRAVLKPYFDDRLCRWLDVETETIFRCLQSIDLLEKSLNVVI